MWKANLADAGITALFLAALCLGVDVRIIFGVWLALTIIGELAKALAAYLAPVVDALKKATGRA